MTKQRSYPSIKKKDEMIMAYKELIKQHPIVKDGKAYALVEKGTTKVQTIRNGTVYLTFVSPEAATAYMEDNERTTMWEVLEVQFWTTV